MWGCLESGLVAACGTALIPPLSTLARQGDSIGAPLLFVDELGEMTTLYPRCLIHHEILIPEQKAKPRMPYIQSQKDGSLLLQIHVQPRASSTGAVGLHGEALKVRLNCPPVDGKANKVLLAFIAKQLGLPKTSVSLVKGRASRSKQLRVVGVDADGVRKCFAGVG